METDRNGALSSKQSSARLELLRNAGADLAIAVCALSGDTEVVALRGRVGRALQKAEAARKEKKQRKKEARREQRREGLFRSECGQFVGME